ncbi:hypothetical protein ACMH5Q_11275 [Aquirufa lenticrescens]
MELAPIILFTYARPNHTKKVLDALFLNPEAKFSVLYIFCDGPKDHCDEDLKHRINENKKIIESEDRFKGVKKIFNKKNLGLSKSIINGVSFVLNAHNKAIILEDDIIPQIGFLRYMNSALDLYENDKRVGCIHAWNHPLKAEYFNSSTFFLPGADCWGWATWKRAWNLFNSSGIKLLDEIISLEVEYSFNRRGTVNFMGMLQDQINGKNDSWAIRWHASLFLNKMFCLHPVNAIVENIGFDGSGEHSGVFNMKQKIVPFVQLEKIEVVDSSEFYDAFNHFISQNLLKKIIIKGLNIFKKLLNVFRNTV